MKRIILLFPAFAILICSNVILNAQKQTSQKIESAFSVSESKVSTSEILFRKFPDGVAPVIDGTVDILWDEVEVHNIDKQFVGDDPFTLNQATWQAAWNDTALFIIIVVEDDDFYPPWESGDVDWMSDKPEIYIDVNDELEDGVGPSTSNSGHYQVAPTFKEGYDQFDTSGYILLANAYLNLTYGYNVSDPNYVFEYAININSLTTENGDTLNPYTIDIMGFDIYIIDRDDDVLSRKRAVWVNDGTNEQAYFDMDDCGEVTFCGGNLRSPEISLSDTCLNFGDVFLDYSTTETLYIYNMACDDTLKILDISSTLSEFTVDIISLDIPPGSFDTANITFTPSGSAVFDGYLYIYSNDVDTVLCLSGNGVPPPEISVLTDSLKTTLQSCNDSVILPLTIYNNGDGELTFSILSQYTDPGSILNSLSAPLTKKNERANSPIYSQQVAIQRTIDKFNIEKERYLKSGEYRNNSSVAVKSDNIIYVDVNSLSSLENGSLENPYKTIAAGVAAAANGDIIVVVPGIYYEQEISINKSLTMNGNGAVIIGNGSGSIFGVHSSAYDATIKNFTITNCEWGIFIYDGSVSIINNTIYNHSNSGVAMFSDAIIMNNIIGNAVFGIAYYSGTLENYYNNVYNNLENWNDCSPGTGSISQDPLFINETVNNFMLQPGSPCINAGNPDFQYNDTDASRNDMGAYGGPEINAYFVLNWLSYLPVDGTVNANDSIIILVQFKSTDLEVGTYHSNIYVNSNDPLNPQIIVPCKLTITQSPIFTLSDTCLDFGDVFQGISVTDTLLINYTGPDVLTISSITSTLTEFTVDPTALDIARCFTGSVHVTYTPLTIGNHNGYLNIFNSYVDTFLYLSGVGLANSAPIVSDIPDMTVNMGETFPLLDLDPYVEDVETSDEGITWTVSGNDRIVISILNGFASFTITDNTWFGSETVTFTANDNGYSPLSASDEVTLTVNEVVGVNNIQTTGVNIYPNPSSEFVYIVFENGINAEVTIEVIDILGQVVSIEKKEMDKNVIELNISDLRSGLYFIKMATSTDVYTSTVIVEE